MLKGLRIGIAVPCLNEALNLSTVINGIPEWVDEIVIVDDASVDGTREVAKTLEQQSSRVSLVCHPINKGVGAAISTAMSIFAERKVPIVGVMAGDNQMDPNLLRHLVEPVAAGRFDMVKTNRLLNRRTLNEIPKVRFIGNSILSFLTKLASGFWGIGDAQSGFIVVGRRALTGIDWNGLYPRYGYPNQLLVEMNILGLRVGDLPTPPRYGVGEESKLRIRNVLVRIPIILAKGFFKRLWRRHVLRDPHPLVLYYTTSIAAGLLGLVLGLRVTVQWLQDGFAPPVTTLSFAAVTLAFILTIGLGMWMDIDANRELHEILPEVNDGWDR